jgi:hypothetical protein
MFMLTVSSSLLLDLLCTRHARAPRRAMELNRVLESHGLETRHASAELYPVGALTRWCV